MKVETKNLSLTKVMQVQETQTIKQDPHNLIK